MLKNFTWNLCPTFNFSQIIRFGRMLTNILLRKI